MSTIRAFLRSSAAQWAALAVLAVVALVLGYVGYDQHFRSIGRDHRPTDLIYLDIKLFSFGGDFGARPLPVELEIARFLAPFVGGFSALKALALLFRDRIDVIRARTMRDHVVVVGADEAGAALARTLADAGRRVVVIGDGDGRRSALRRTGCTVVDGDDHADALASASAQRAATIVSLSDDSAANARIVMAVRDQRRPSGRPVTCLIRLDDPEICRLLRLHELQHPRPDVTLDFINPGESVVRQIVRHVGDRSPVRLVGPSDFLRQLEVALQGRDQQPNVVEPVSPGAPVAGSDGCAVVVCERDDGETLKTALAALAELDDRSVLIAVFRVPAGLGRLLERGEGRTPVVVLDLITPLTSADAIRPHTVEELGRAVHESYVAKRRASGEVAADDPSLAPWELLDDGLRESNRQQALTIIDRLAGIGAVVVPLHASRREEFELTDGEVELLARSEHARWVEERRAAGWKPGVRDATRSTSPHLVDWDQLDDATREIDREAIRAIPTVLRAAGLRPVRADAQP